MFNIGDTVLYGSNGMCEITDISTVDMPGIKKDRLFYILKQKNGHDTIYVATDDNTSKMRKVLSKDEAENLIKSIAQIEALTLVNEKKPDSEFKAALQKYDCVEMLKLIKCIYLRKKQRIAEGKKVSAADEKYMRLAEDMLYQEIGEALEIPREDVLNFLIKEIEGK